MSTRTFFASAATDGTIGLFTSDGTPGDTVQIVVPGASAGGITPTNITVIGSKVLFTGLDALGLSNLFAYDGTTATASKVVVTGGTRDDLNPQGFTVVGSTVLFSSRDATAETNLFIYDATTGKGAKVSVGGASNYSLNPQGFTVAGSKVLFGGSDSANRISLFTYDVATGSAAELSVTGANGYYGLDPQGFTVAGAKVLFRGNDKANDGKLFTYDIATGSVAEVSVTGANGFYGLKPQGFTVAGSKVLFQGYDTANQYNLFAYDIATGSVAEVSVPSAGSYGLEPDSLTFVGSKVLFVGVDSAYRSSLFSYDTTTGGVTEVSVTGANSGVNSGSEFYKGSAVAGDKVLFSSMDLAGNIGLFSFDSTSDTAAEIMPADGGPLGAAQDFISGGSIATFYATDASGYFGYWKSDGTTAGTVELFSPGKPQRATLNPAGLIVADSKVVFEGQDSLGQGSLFTYDVATGSVAEARVTSIDTSYGVNPYPVAAVGSKVLFVGTDGTPMSHQYNLSTYDTATGKVVELDVTGGGIYGLNPYNFTVAGSKVLFESYDGTNNSNLFAYDAGTGSAAEVNITGASTNSLNPSDFTVAGSKVLFAGQDSANQSSLFTYDTSTGSGTKVSVTTSSNGLNPSNIAVAGSKVLFDGQDSANDYNLFTYDIATGSVAEVGVTSASSNGLNPGPFTVAGPKVLFVGKDSINHNSLFTFDTATGSVAEVSVTGASSDGLDPHYFVAAGSKVVFGGKDSANIYNLFSYDIATGNVAEVSVKGAGSHGLDPSNFVVAGSKVLFQDYSSGFSTSLFSYDTTTGSAAEVSVTGASAYYGLSPHGFTVAGSKVLFQGYDSANGSNLFSYDTVTDTVAEVGVTGANSYYGLSPQGFTVAGSKVLFQGYDSAKSYNLFSYDIGTGAVTEVAAPGAADALPALSTSYAAPGFANPAPSIAITSASVAGNTAAQVITGTLTARGFASAAGQVVMLSDNGVTLPTAAPVVTDAQGRFSVPVVLPFEGSNSLVASGTDNTGATAGSATVVDMLDSVAPTLTLAVPGTATPAANPALSPYGTETVTGTLTSGGTASVVGQVVTLTANGAPLATVAPIVTDAQGRFSASIDLPAATVAVVASSRDSYGNAGTSRPATAASHVDAGLFGMATTDPNGVAGQVYGLYEAVLGRAPDPTGYEALVGAVNAGTTLADISQIMLASAEYTARYGAAAQRSATDFVTTLYQDALGRSPETNGLQYWSNLLANGASQAQVVAGIGLSPESIGRIQPAFAAPGGIFVPSEADASVARLYYGLLNRAPDAAGLQFLEGVLAQGSLADVVSDILASPEYLGASSGLSDGQFVQSLYGSALGRAPDPGGYQGWTAALSGGTSRAFVALGIGESTEAKAHLAPMIEVGFKLA